MFAQNIVFFYIFCHGGPKLLHTTVYMIVLIEPDLDHSSPVALLLQEVLLEGRQTVQMVLCSLHIILKHRSPFLQ